MYNVMDVARFVVNYSIDVERPITNLKLQKILYFIQVSFIKKYGETCFAEPIVHWRHGPVVGIVYQKYRGYGISSITEQETKYISFNFDVDCMKFIMEHRKYNEYIFHPKHLILMKSIIEKYQDISPWDMAKLTQQEEPWKRTKIDDEITVDMIKQYC